MQTQIAPSTAAYHDDPSRTADHGHYSREGSIREPNCTNEDILAALRDLFAGKRQMVLGQDLEWWSESFQADMPHKEAAGIVLEAMWGREIAPGVTAKCIEILRSMLILRARILIARSVRDTGTAQI